VTEDFVSRLRLELREAARREERRGPVGRRIAGARRRLPAPPAVAVALAAALLAVVVALGASALRGEPEPAEHGIVGRFQVASGLSPVAAGSGAVWTADPIRHRILRIDPGTRRVTARIPIDDEATVATGAGAVWALAGDLLYSGDRRPLRLLRIDPATNRIVARIALRTPAGATFGPRELWVGEGVVWVVGADGALRVDPSRDRPDRWVPFPHDGGEATRGALVGRDRVTLLTTDGRLRTIDARSGRTVGDVGLRAPADAHLLPAPPGTVAVAAADRIALHDRDSGRELWRARVSGEIRFSHADDDGLWLHVARDTGGPDRLVRLDARSGRRIGQVDLPERGVAGLAPVGSELWVATPGGRILVVR
jgi:hypothetical protein